MCDDALGTEQQHHGKDGRDPREWPPGFKVDMLSGRPMDFNRAKELQYAFNPAALKIPQTFSTSSADGGRVASSV